MLITNIFKAEIDFWKSKRNLKNASSKVLSRILLKASKTKLAKRYKITDKMTISDFRSAFPIHNYSKYQPWIEQIRKGEPDVLWPGLPISFATTSGTTGDPKIIPMTSDFILDYHKDSILSMHRAICNHPEIIFGKILVLGGPSIEGYFNKIPFGSITGILYSTFPKIILSHLALPIDSYNIQSYEIRLYLIARLALEANISAIISVVPGSLLVLAETIHRMADKLINEIELGYIENLELMPRNLKLYLQDSIKPNPARANALRNILKQNTAIKPKEIWPIKLLCSYIKEGSEIQWKKIRKYYGNANIMDPGIVSSEGRVSIGLKENESSSAVIPSASFVEFVSVNNLDYIKIEENSQTIMPHELQKGFLYSPIISSSNGLLRYCTSDVVRVVKIEDGIPFIEFVGRIDGTVSIAGEKLTETHFRQAIELLKDYIISDWAVYVDAFPVIPNYVFVCTTNAFLVGLDIALESTLQKVNPSYKRKRDQLLLNPIQIKIAHKTIKNTNIEKPNYRLGQTKQKRLFNNYQNFVKNRPDITLV